MTIMEKKIFMCESGRTFVSCPMYHYHAVEIPNGISVHIRGSVRSIENGEIMRFTASRKASDGRDKTMCYVRFQPLDGWHAAGLPDIKPYRTSERFISNIMYYISDRITDAVGEPAVYDWDKLGVTMIEDGTDLIFIVMDEIELESESPEAIRRLEAWKSAYNSNVLRTVSIISGNIVGTPLFSDGCAHDHTVDGAIPCHVYNKEWKDQVEYLANVHAADGDSVECDVSLHADRYTNRFRLTLPARFTAFDLIWKIIERSGLKIMNRFAFVRTDEENEDM